MMSWNFYIYNCNPVSFSLYTIFAIIPPSTTPSIISLNTIFAGTFGPSQASPFVMPVFYYLYILILFVHTQILRSGSSAPCPVYNASIILFLYNDTFCSHIAIALGTLALFEMWVLVYVYIDNFCQCLKVWFCPNFQPKKGQPATDSHLQRGWDPLMYYGI